MKLITYPIKKTMGLFGFRKSKSSNINELIKHFSVIHNMIDRKINLLSKGEIRDDINMVKSESFAINLYKEGVLKGLGSCSIDNTKGDYKIDDNGKVSASDILVKIINSDDLEYFKDDLFFMHTYLDLIIKQ